MDSDKFTFPDGSSRTLTLDRPTTPVRIQARSRTSGDRLPVGVTLTTPDGQLVIARTALTVHSTSISMVGVALTCAGRAGPVGLVGPHVAPGPAAAARGPPEHGHAPPSSRSRPAARRGLSLSTAASYVAVGHRGLPPHGPAADRGAGLGPGPDPPGRRLQPGQHHPQHALRHRAGRGALGHVHPGLRRPARQPDRGRGVHARSRPSSRSRWSSS